MGVRTRERKGGTGEVLMATPCTNSLRGESRGASDSAGNTWKVESKQTRANGSLASSCDDPERGAIPIAGAIKHLHDCG